MPELPHRHHSPLVSAIKDPLLEGGLVQHVPGAFDDIEFITAHELFALTQHAEVYIRDVIGIAVISNGIVRQVEAILQVEVS